jgi:hypothetical protein
MTAGLLKGIVTDFGAEELEQPANVRSVSIIALEILTVGRRIDAPSRYQLMARRYFWSMLIPSDS